MTAKYRPTRVFRDGKNLYIISNGKRIYVTENDIINPQLHRMYKKKKVKKIKPKQAIQKTFEQLFAKAVGGTVTPKIKASKASTERQIQYLREDVSKLVIEKNRLLDKVDSQSNKVMKMMRDLHDRDQEIKELKKPEESKQLDREIENKQQLLAIKSKEASEVQNKLATRTQQLFLNEKQVAMLSDFIQDKEKKLVKLEQDLEKEQKKLKNTVDVSQNLLVRQNIKRNNRDKKMEISKNALISNIKEEAEKNPAILEKLKTPEAIKLLDPDPEKAEKKAKKLFAVKSPTKLISSGNIGSIMFPEITKGPDLYKRTKEIFGKDLAQKFYKLEKKPEKVEPIKDDPEEESKIEVRKEGKYGNGTTDYQLNSIMQQFPGYIGCVSTLEEFDKAMNILAKNIYKSPVHSFIYGVADKQYPNHWRAVFIDLDRKYVGFYDSFGKDNIFLRDKIEAMFNDIQLPWHMVWKYNKVKIQPDRSDLCGLYCTYNLTMQYYGHNFKESTGYQDSNIDDDLAKSKRIFGFV